MRRFEVFLDRLDRTLLVLGLAVRELGLEPLEPLVVERVRGAGRLLPLGVEADQVARELVHPLARTCLEPVPRLAAELRQRRRLRVRPDVARDLADLLVRYVQPVVAAKREEEVVASDARDRLRLEAEQLADTVVFVDDVVAGAQVGERLQRPAAHPPGTRGASAEDLRVGEQDEREVAPDEAAPRRSDREHEPGLGRQPLPLLEHARLDPPQHVLRPQSLALVRERDDDAVARAYEPGELLLGLGEAARGDRGLLRLERERLPGRERVELARAFQVEVVAPELLEPDALDLAELPHEVGRAVEDGHEVLGNARQLALLLK